MKSVYNLFFCILIFFISCKNGVKDVSVSTGTITDTLKKNQPGDALVSLSDEQIRGIDLQTGTIELRNLKTMLKVNGKLTLPPHNQAQVSALVGGIVKTIAVTEGQFVNKGQVLAMLINNEVIQLQQDYLENESRLIYLQQETKRQKSLQEENINALKIVQQVQNELGVAEAKQQGMREKLNIYGIDPGKISRSNFKNSVAVVAPISGYIHHVNLTMGKYAESNTVFFDIVDNRFLHLDLTVFEKDIHKIKAGQKLTFTDANDKTHIHPATIFALNKAFETGEQAIIVHAKIDEKTETLLPGMYVEAGIQIDDNRASSLPDEAIASNGDEHFIYVQTTRNQYRQIAVKTGTADRGYTEIIALEKIPAGSRVVTKGAYYLLSQLTKGDSERHD